MEPISPLDFARLAGGLMVYVHRAVDRIFSSPMEDDRDLTYPVHSVKLRQLNRESLEVLPPAPSTNSCFDWLHPRRPGPLIGILRDET